MSSNETDKERAERWGKRLIARLARLENTASTGSGM